MPAKTIEHLIAESEIRDVHLRTCLANDRRDEALMRGCFHADAVIELHETFDVDGFIALGRTALSRFVVTWHNTGNQLVEVTGDIAHAEHYITSSHRSAADNSGPAHDFIVFGRYIDRMERATASGGSRTAGWWSISPAAIRSSRSRPVSHEKKRRPASRTAAS